MSDENLFVVQETTVVPNDVDHLAELVGDGKKFKDVASLAKGKAEADAYIATLTKKLDELNGELKTRSSMTDILTEIQKLKEPGQQQQASTPASQHEGPDDSTLEQKLEALLAAREATRTAQTNAQKVNEALKANFGDMAIQAINHKANELGMSVASLQQIANSSPAAFLNLMGIQANPQAPSPVPVPRSGIATGAQNPLAPVRNAAYYEKMKRENPTQYFDPKTTVQQIKDATALGDKYFQ